MRAPRPQPGSGSPYRIESLRLTPREAWARSRSAFLCFLFFLSGFCVHYLFDTCYIVPPPEGATMWAPHEYPFDRERPFRVQNNIRVTVTPEETIIQCDP